MLTINEEIVKKEKKGSVCFTVRLRFTLYRKLKRMPTSIYLSPKDVTKSGKIRINSPKRQEIAELISSYYEKCSALKIELNSYSLDYIFAYLRADSVKNSLIDFFKLSEDWINKATIKGAPNYRTALNSFKRFIGKDYLDIRDITSITIQNYKAFLEAERNKRAHIKKQKGERVPSDRTLSLYLMSIKKLYNSAKQELNDDENGVIILSADPFATIKIPKQEATRKRAIDAAVIAKIASLPDKRTFKGIHHTNRYNLAKDCFILSFCLIGMNSADLYSATEFDGKKITYYREKTTERRLDDAKMEVVVPKLCVPIFNRYRDTTGKRLFNFYQYYSDDKTFNKAINKGLKQIGKELKIEDLEFYAARHSWATIAVNKVKIDKYTVHAALNHIDESMKVTDIYIKRDFAAENNANQKVLKYVFRGKRGFK